MTGLRLEPKRRERLGDQLYGQILEQIVSGALKEGDRLPSEKQICESFQVSRPVVREALMRLQADGLVIARQGSGTYVQRRPPQGLTRFADSSDVAGLLRGYEVRMSLEAEAAGLAARRRTTPQLERIAAALSHMEEGFRTGEVPSGADFAFHRAVAEASGNDLFVLVLETLRGIMESGMALALKITREGSRERIRRVIDEHTRIYEAIELGDSDGAAMAMRYHIARARQRVTDHQKDV